MLTKRGRFLKLNISVNNFMKNKIFLIIYFALLGDLSSMLREQKISNHGGKFL